MLTRRTLLAASATALAGTSAQLSAQAGRLLETFRIDGADLQMLSSDKTGDAVRLSQPCIQLTKDYSARLTLHNALSEPASLRGDGERGWGAPNSWATQPFLDLAPGEARAAWVTYRDSGTTLLRAPPSAAQLAARGLIGTVVVDEPEPLAVDKDLVVLVADRLFAADGTPRFGSVPAADAATSTVTVNGDPAPWELEARPFARLRLRIVNGSTRRLMLLACQGASPTVVAVDGQPSEGFRPAKDTLPVGPGARYDVLLDLPGTIGGEVQISLKPTERLGGALEPERLLVRLRAQGTPLPTRPPPTPLPRNPALPVAIPLEAAKRADLVIAGTPGTPNATPHGWSVNRVSGGNASMPVISVRMGQAVVLGLINTTPMLVPLRISGHPVRLLHALDDGWDPYWRDTLLLPPGSRNHVAFVADTPGRWAIDSGYDDLTLAGLSCTYEVRPG